MSKREQFIEKLQLLLKEFDCELNVDDHYDGYPECGQDLRIGVIFNDYRTDPIDLGSWVDELASGNKDWRNYEH